MIQRSVFRSSAGVGRGFAHPRTMRRGSQHPWTLGVLLAVLLGCCATGYAQQSQLPGAVRRGPGPPAAGQGQPEYVNLFVAMLALPETQIIVKTYFNTFKGISEGSPFQDLLNLAQNASAPSTWFWPEDSAWPPLEAQVCMSLDKIQNTLASAPPIAAQLMRSIAITNRTILSDDFKAGQPMQTLEPGFSLTLSKRTENGRTQWYFPGAAFNGSDVTVVRTNITAGAAVIHFVDTLVFNSEQRKFWQNQRDNIGEQGCRQFRNETVAAAPAGSTAPSPGVIAGVVVAAVVAVAVAATAVYFLLSRRRQPARDRVNEVVGNSANEPHLPGPACDIEGNTSYARPAEHKDAATGVPAVATAVFAGAAAGALQNRIVQPSITSVASPVVCSASATAESEASVSTSQTSQAVPSLYERDEVVMAPVFEANPVVSSAKLQCWLTRYAGQCRNGGAGDNSSGDSGQVAVFAERLRRELDPQTGNPNITHNYTAFTREVEHSSTAVYFCEGKHNHKQFALKLYARPEDFSMELRAYKALGGLQNKYVPVLEMSYPGNDAFPTSVLVFERGQSTLEEFARRQPSIYQQIDIFHQIVNAVQHLHDHNVVHRDMKPSNVVRFSEFAWKLIDLATIAQAGEVAKIVYTREYCSPEVAAAVVSGAGSMVVNPASDLWGVGVIMYELATGQRYFPPEWSLDGGRRIWSALCGFEPLPHEMCDITQLRGADRGVMKLVRRLLQRDPSVRPGTRQLLNERLFHVGGNTTTQISQGSSVSHGSAGSVHWNMYGGPSEPRP